MLHGFNFYQTVYDMSMAKMCAYPPYQHAFPHWKFLLRCCESCANIDLPSQHLDKHHSNTCPTICFHHGFKVCTGTYYLVGFIRNDDSKIDWLQDCTFKWENYIQTIR